MNFKLKLLGAAVLPVILISVASFWVIQNRTQDLARTQIAEVEQRTMDARRAELEKMNRLAINGVRGLLEDTTLPEEIAKERAKRLLNNMAFGKDGYFFVYAQDGTNLVHPRLPELVGKNWWDLQDPNGNFVIRGLMAAAKSGNGFHSYVWNKPSTGVPEPKIGHAVFLERWGWMIGTGLYTDDVEAEIASMRAALKANVDRTRTVLLALTIAGVFLATLFASILRFTEQRFANRRLRELTHRIVEVQENERKRVSTELHDGISQLLVSARYGLDQALARVGGKADARTALQKSMGTIDGAISEVRRISMALRPSVLDDIGLAAAISSLGREFGERTGVHVETNVDKVGPYLSENARTAMYRVAQEALTNIAKHADAKNVTIELCTHSDGVCLRVEDDGKSLRMPARDGKQAPHQGMGLRNMRERMDAFDGTLDIKKSARGGLLVKAFLPANGSIAEPPESTNDNLLELPSDAA